METNKNIKFFGSYQVEAKLAEGAFSEVLRVSLNHQNFALKKLRPHLQFDYEYTALLETEALLLSKIKDSEHFPLFYEKGKEQTEHYLIIELIEGLNLEKIIEKSFKKNLPASVATGTKIALEICKGLENLQKLNLFPQQATVHGDLRASNVMLSEDGKIKMIDLGLKGGTFDYMPLERLHDQVISAYTDIYALGHILYEIFHGQRLFKGKSKLESYMEMRDLKVDESIFKNSLPLKLKKILVRCLNQEEKIHYTRLEELHQDLENLTQDEACDLQSLKA